MKNMKKFITLCGFLILGSIACGDADVVKAEAINNQTTDTSGYTITIPSEVSIDKNSGKGSFAVSGKAEAQVDLNVSVSSKNNYKLKNKSQEISYSLDKESFHIDNKQSASSKSFDENFNIALANTNTNYSGPYKDRLAFNIQCHKYTYELDMNSILDGVRENERHNYGAVDVYINGVLKAENVSDFKEILNYGDTYEFKNIKATDGHHFVGINSCANTSIKGRIGADTNYLETRRDNPYNLVAPIYFEFNTNKLTINYHADGAQTWIHFDSVTYDVSGKDTAGSETHLFGSYYDEKHGLGDVRRLTKKGYTAKPNTWIVGKNGTKEVSDNVGLAKSQDVAEYCGVLDEFKKNDTVIDLYPIWSPVQSQLNLNANGGTFSDNSTFKKATDKLVYDSSSNVNISSYTPTRKGYDFDGWYTDEAGGTKVYNADGSAVNGTQYWQNNVYQNIEGTNILRGDAGQNMAECLFYGNSYKVFDGKITDNDWVNDSSLKYGKCKKITISPAQVENNSYRGSYSGVLYNYSYRSSYPIAALCDKKVQLSFKIKSDSPMTFDCWGLENTTAHSPYELKTDSKWKAITVYTTLTDAILSGPCSLVFYTSSSAGTYYVGDVSITLDTDIELFAHWTKKNYSTGTVLNIEGNDYIVMGQTEDGNYRLISGTNIGNMQYQPNQDSNGNYYDVGKYNENDLPETRYDGQNSNVYEDSYIDKYLESTYYNSLPEKLKKAIVATQIKQASYTNMGSNSRWSYLTKDTNPVSPDGTSSWFYNEGTAESPKYVRYDKITTPDGEGGVYPLKYWIKKEKGYGGQSYNTITRHVYLPSVEEISNLVDLNDANKTYTFLKGTNNSLNHMWLRDASSASPHDAVNLVHDGHCLLGVHVINPLIGVRPAFVVDLSKIDYTVTGSVNYK